LTFRLVLTALAFALRASLSLFTFGLKLRTRLFFLKRAYVSKMKKALEKDCLPEDLREELLKLYSKELDKVTSTLSSIAKTTNLMGLLRPRRTTRR